jgi:hypothetical protein
MISSPGMELIFKGDLEKFILDKYSRNLMSEKLMFLIVGTPGFFARLGLARPFSTESAKFVE